MFECSCTFFKMSYFDILPVELQETIYAYKFHLETKDLQSFVDDFDVSILSTKKTKENNNKLNNILHYQSQVHLMYKPTRKCMLLPYGYVIVNSNFKKPSTREIIYNMCYNAYYLRYGLWTCVKNMNGEWDTDCSYRNYENNSNEHGHMSLKRFVYWKNMVRKIEIMLGDRFHKFIKCYEEEE